jgi:hypothetical protein
MRDTYGIKVAEGHNHLCADSTTSCAGVVTNRYRRARDIRYGSWAVGDRSPPSVQSALTPPRSCLDPSSLVDAGRIRRGCGWTGRTDPAATDGIGAAVRSHRTTTSPGQTPRDGNRDHETGAHHTSLRRRKATARRLSAWRRRGACLMPPTIAIRLARCRSELGRLVLVQFIPPWAQWCTSSSCTRLWWTKTGCGAARWGLVRGAGSVRLPKHADEHRSERPVLLAFDQQVGEGPGLGVPQ